MALPEAVQVAAITGLSAVMAAAVPATIAFRRTTKTDKKLDATAAAIGTPNGQGNLVQMAERILAGQVGQDNRLAKLEAGQAHHAGELAGVRASQQDTRTEVARLEGRVTAIESSIANKETPQ